MAIPQITALARRASRSDPDDVREQTFVHQAVLELTELFHRSGARDLARCMETVGVVTDALGRGEWLDPRRMADVVAKLLHIVDEHALERQSDPAPGSAPTPKRIDLGPEPPELPKIDDLVLGEVLFHLGFVTRQKILQALHVQQVNGKRIGEALIASGAASAEQVEIGLRVQERLRSSGSDLSEAVGGEADETSAWEQNRPAGCSLLGEVMVHLGFVTTDQVKLGVELQREKGMLIGEALVELGFVNWDEVVEAIGVQKRLRHASGLPAPS